MSGLAKLCEGAYPNYTIIFIYYAYSLNTTFFYIIKGDRFLS